MPANTEGVPGEPRNDDATTLLETVSRVGRYEPPSVLAEKQAKTQRLILLVVRMLFLVLLVTVTVMAAMSESADRPGGFSFGTLAGLLLGATAVGVLVLLLDALTPNKRLSAVIGVYLGLCLGLIGAMAIGALVDVVAGAWKLTEPPFSTYIGLGKVVVAIVLCYLAVSMVLTTKEDFRLVIPYVEFHKQVRGVRPLVLDSSALIDGRIDELGRTGFIDAPLVVPRFVIDELQLLADSGDKLKRARGRRGLTLMSELQANPFLDVSIDDTEVEGRNVDKMLLQLASDQSLRILTTDYNLNKVAQIQGVPVLNLNDVANTLKPNVIPGETMRVQIVKAGEGPGQGVGYMADGTMVVVEEAAASVGQDVNLVVTNSLQTSAGRMIFGRIEGSDGAADQMARAATHQPRATGGGPLTGARGKAEEGFSRRNPRR